MSQLRKDICFIGATLVTFCGGYFISTALAGYCFEKINEERKKLDQSSLSQSVGTKEENLVVTPFKNKDMQSSKK